MSASLFHRTVVIGIFLLIVYFDIHYLFISEGPTHPLIAIPASLTLLVCSIILIVFFIGYAIYAFTASHRKTFMEWLNTES